MEVNQFLFGLDAVVTFLCYQDSLLFSRKRLFTLSFFSIGGILLFLGKDLRFLNVVNNGDREN